MERPIICWFRNNLRITDNPALHSAIKTGAPIICVYIYDEKLAQQWHRGRASQWWLHHSLKKLSESLEKIGIKLILRKGESLKELEKLYKESNATGLYFIRQYAAYDSKLEDKIYSKFKDDFEIRRFKSYLLFEPEDISTLNNEPYKVFTPFYRTYLKQAGPSTPLPAPRKCKAFAKKLASEQLKNWQLLPNNPDWSQQFSSIWTPGEKSALKMLKNFTQGPVSKYAVLRDRPDVYGTSRLSPHLHFGEISPRQVWHAVKNTNYADSSGATSYLRELVWRDFAYNLLTHWPTLPDEEFKKEFKSFPWLKNTKHLRAWQKGQTGYPIVDAGMRQLWATGWMHNRVRMIVASFLVKHLLICWDEGEKWFWDTLVDADLGNNSASWQWVAGCGADAAPYFRIFNPVLQGKKFDPEGEYVKQWVPELRHTPSKYIHEPWLMPNDLLQQDTTSKDYPKPIVEHKFARDRALAALKKVKAA